VRLIQSDMSVAIEGCCTTDGQRRPVFVFPSISDLEKDPPSASSIALK
jgi:hypothetical protein